MLLPNWTTSLLACAGRVKTATTALSRARCRNRKRMKPPSYRYGLRSGKVPRVALSGATSVTPAGGHFTGRAGEENRLPARKVLRRRSLELEPHAELQPSRRAHRGHFAIARRR